MAVLLSPVGGVAAQFFDNNGVPLAGGKLYTYSAGTTTPAATYTSSLGVTAHTNPIVLDSGGRVPGGEIWLTDGVIYKFVLQTSTNVLIATYDNIVGINSNFVNYTTEQEIQTATAGQTVFNLTTTQYQPGTNSLSVYVDGVNQYGPGAQYAYLETDSDTVTFVSGLHVGASVKFTTATQTTGNATDASVVAYTPPYTGSVTTTVEAKLAQNISVTDFGASPAASAAANATAFQAAVNAAAGRRIYVPQGQYNIGSTITCPSGTWLEGDGAGETILQGSANVNVLLFQDASVADYTGAGISRLKITGSGVATSLVIVNNVWGFTAQNCFIRGVPTVFRCIEIQRYSFECKIDSCRITDMTESGVYINEIAGEPPNGCMITNCDFSPEDGGYGVYDEAVNTRIIGNWFEYALGFGGTSIYSTGSPQIIGNNVADGYSGDYAIHLNGTNRASISSNSVNMNGATAVGIFVENSVNTIIDGNTYNIDVAEAFVSILNSDRTIISNNAGQGTVSGIYNVTSIYIVQGTSQDTQIVNNAFSFSGTATGKGVTVSSGALLTNITENTFLGLVTGVDVQTNASNRRVNIIGNSLISVTNPIVFVNGLDVYLYNNQGFRTENRGYPATIASGNTRVTVAHGLAVTPPTSGIRLTLVDALGGSGGATTNNVQGPFLVNVDATNIEIGCGANPGASGMLVAWEVTFSI